MGLVQNILLGFIHLFFVAIDLFFLMLIVKSVHDRWKPVFLDKFSEVAEPLIDNTLAYLHDLTLAITRKTYSDRTLAIMLLVAMSLLRFIIASVIA
ncbi:MAG: hypothetical protein K9M75_05190 [Phycisphaerae bacterium]|nr:hypothetical protein [Phycisphaerae bacterium]